MRTTPHRCWLKRTAVCLVAALSTGAVWSPGVVAGPDRKAAALRGIARMLDEDYAGAHAIFDSLIAADPGRPEGYLGRAMAYWEAGQILDGAEESDRDMHRMIDSVLGVSEEHLDANGNEAEMYFWMGSACGLRAALEMTRGQIIDGILDGLQAREFLTQAVAIDPDLVDAHFGLGLADYVAARQPRILRLVSRLFSLPSGDRDSGLAQLEWVAREGTYCRQHAVSSRAYIELYYEKHPEEAHRRFADLIRRYPNSLDYRARHLDAMLALAVGGSTIYHRALIDSALSIQRMVEQREWTLEPWLRTKLIFEEAFGHYLSGNLGRARERMEAYVREADRKSWLLGPAELTLGKLADLRGDRGGATAHYRRALKRENVWGTRAEASNYLRQPFEGDEPARRPPDREKRYPERP